jgi:hypothetical protein
VARKRGESAIERTEFQKLRLGVIKDLRVSIANFLNGSLELEAFKKTIDSINKKHNHWGFRGIKGQMFFNTLSNVAEDAKKLNSELKTALLLPKNIQEAKEKIDNFGDYVVKLGLNAEDKRSFPNLSSVPYFLSYFWQIQDKDKYPVFYHSTDTVFNDLGFTQQTGTWGDRYVAFYNLLEELRELYRTAKLRDYSFWDVEHIFWFSYNEKNAVSLKVVKAKKEKNGDKTSSAKVVVSEVEDDFIPPVVKDIPLLSLGDEELAKEYEKVGKKIEDVFEDKLYKLFVMLGFETQRLGKGKGRVPDGIILARQEQYAVIYDAKSRREPYNIGTDSRAITEYINAYSHQLRREGIRNIYFAIISSDFKEGQNDIVRAIKMDTGVQEFLFLKAELLLYILELKLKNASIELGRSGLQQIFQHHLVITKEEIQEFLYGM